MDTLLESFSDLSITLTKAIPKLEKKTNGIYFTPPGTVKTTLDHIRPYMERIATVLEPSCGSCEYVLPLQQRFPDLKITAIELNPIIYTGIEHLKSDTLDIIQANYLTYAIGDKFDLIIGNPPYYVMPKSSLTTEYKQYYTGRPNIFILFIVKSLALLNPNGILSFILPTSFLNGLYYDNTRKYIARNFTIIDIVRCNDNYLETKQETILLIVQNKQPIVLLNGNYVKELGAYTILSDDIKTITTLYENSTTLAQLGFSVNIGSVVWNQHKAILTSDTTKTKLIYSSDITDHKLVYKTYTNPAKKQYIELAGKTDPVLVINRGYGAGQYNFNYCLINGTDSDPPIVYLIENHLIRVSIKADDAVAQYKKVIASFNNPKTQQFISTYFGNSAMNSTELLHILPIYDI